MLIFILSNLDEKILFFFLNQGELQISAVPSVGKEEHSSSVYTINIKKIYV